MKNSAKTMAKNMKLLRSWLIYPNAYAQNWSISAEHLENVFVRQANANLCTLRLNLERKWTVLYWNSLKICAEWLEKEINIAEFSAINVVVLFNIVVLIGRQLQANPSVVF